MPEKTKLPNRTYIVGDDLPIIQDGQTFHPHAGEKVTFRPVGAQALGGYISILRFQSLQAEMAKASERGELSSEHITSFEALADEATEQLRSVIVSWDWTDNDGAALESPPSLAVLRSMRPEELQWLRSKGLPSTLQGTPRDDSSPSTVS